MQRLGGLVIAPIISTMLGCLYFASIFTSLLNYSSNCSLMFGLKTFFIATYSSKYLPLWMVLKPPIDICSPISKSAKRRVRTPLTDSRSGSNYCASTLLGLILRLAVWSLSSVLNPPVSHPIAVSSITGFFSSTSQLGVSFFFMLLLDLTTSPPSKQLLMASWRLSPYLTASKG